MNARVLLVEDDREVRFGIRNYMASRDILLEEAACCASAIEAFEKRRPDVALVDQRLPDGEGVALIDKLSAIDSGVPVVVLTGHGSIELAVRAMRAGAFHFLTKPVELPSLEAILRRAINKRRSARERAAAGDSRKHAPFDPFRGSSAAIRTLREQAQRIVRSSSPKLLTGETGVGKGVLARWLHAEGPRADGPLVDLNCASLTRELLESELFGHERGAFTGATSAKPGLLEAATGGSLFLDEIGEMHATIQPKVLKVLEEGRVRRVGSLRDREISLHLIAATHRDLPDRARSGDFRADLYFRIATIPLRVPSLRERREDIPELAEHILSEITTREGVDELHLARDALSTLCAYQWPGNIRELRNVLECAHLLCDGREITRNHLRFAFEARAEGPVTEPPPKSALSLADAERRHIQAVLQRHGGRVDEAARTLGVPRSTLYYKLKKHGIVPSKI